MVAQKLCKKCESLRKEKWKSIKKSIDAFFGGSITKNIAYYFFCIVSVAFIWGVINTTRVMFSEGEFIICLGIGIMLCYLMVKAIENLSLLPILSLFCIMIGIVLENTRMIKVGNLIIGLYFTSAFMWRVVGLFDKEEKNGKRK